MIGEAGTCEGALAEISRVNPDLVVFEAEFLQNFDIHFYRQMKTTCSHLKTLVLSPTWHELIAWEFLKSGANGYILQDQLCGELAYAIRTILHGGVWISPSLAEKMIRRALMQETHPNLSGNEIKLLKMLSDGKKEGEIATALTVSERTIRNYLRQILEKIGVNTKLQAVAWAARHGLLE